MKKFRNDEEKRKQENNLSKTLELTDSLVMSKISLSMRNLGKRDMLRNKE